MRNSYLIFSVALVLICSFYKVDGQNFGWTECYGTNLLEYGCGDGSNRMGAITTKDNGIAIISSTADIGGDVPGNNGSCDLWVVKLDTALNVEWSKNLGDINEDIGYSIDQAEDSSFYVVGYTRYLNTAYTHNLIIKLDPRGNIINQRVFGGIAGHEVRPFLVTSKDNGVVVISNTSSNDGDVSGNHGSTLNDIWIVKLDSSLNIEWQRCYGGSSQDFNRSRIIRDAGSGFIFGAGVYSSNGDLTVNNGLDDAWIVHLDSVGNFIWRYSIGGSKSEEPYNLLLSPDSSIYVVGYTSSSYHGSTDAWIVKLSYTGSLIWSKVYGGSLRELGRSIYLNSNNQLIVVGSTESNDQDVSGNLSPSVSGWVFCVDTSGTLLWQKCIPVFPYHIFETFNSTPVILTDANAPSCNRGMVALTEFKLSNIVKGKVYVDSNGNSLFDSGEHLYPEAMISSVRSGVDTIYTYTNENGNFWVYPEIGAYQFSLSNSLPYYTFSPQQYNHVYSGAGVYDSVEFALTPIPDIQDLLISILPLDFPRPGSNSRYIVHYENVGTDTVTGTVVFIKDSLTNFVSSIPSVSRISGDSIFWNYSSLRPFQKREIKLTLAIPIPPMINGGDFLNSAAIILPNLTDSVPSDNFASLDQIVVNSFDPNDKLIVGRDSIIFNTDSSFITYMIRFQNTGTAFAFTIIIRDTINNDFDITSLQMVSSSHSYELLRENNVLNFVFNNIYLADSGASQLLSNGYICYKIKIKPGHNGNIIIPNKAAIYFDYNQPVTTNTCNLYVNSVIGFEDASKEQNNLIIYPNPSSESIDVFLRNQNDEFKNAFVTNALGEILIVADDKRIDISSLSVGIYFIQVSSRENRFYTTTFIKN
jgi:hypothetical protein